MSLKVSVNSVRMKLRMLFPAVLVDFSNSKAV